MFDAISLFKSSPPPAAHRLPERAGDAQLQRMDGLARVAVSGGGNAITDLYQRSPGKVLFPRIDDGTRMEAVFLNTAGGVAGGDRLSFEARARDGARLTATTQAAERIYRAIDSHAHIETRLSAESGAALEWLPQETILFDRSRLQRKTEVRLHQGASLIALEWLVLGRAAHGETVKSGSLRDTWRVFRDGRLIWADTFRLEGDIAALTKSPALLGGRTALATLLYAAPDALLRVERAREILHALPVRSGATVVSGLLICRFAARLAHDLRKSLIVFLQAFRDGLRGFTPALPRVWSC